MSDNHEHSRAATRPRLKLSAFRIVPVERITQNRILIRDLLFGGRASSTEVVFEVNPISGYVSYRHTKKLYREEKRKNLALPRTKEDATQAAKTFLSERYEVFITNRLLQQTFADALTKGKPLIYPFSMIPPPQWLKHAGTYLVRNDKHDQPDHWLCKFQVEIGTADGKKLAVLSSSLDVRLGESANGGGAQRYEVIGFQSRWRPIYDHYRVEQFLPDTGEPDHEPAEEQSAGPAGHVHLDELTLLSYLLADENVPQFNLLPYEATVSGEHHLSVLPASKDSVWVELNVRKVTGKYKVQALLLGGSGNYEACWGFWDPYAYEFPGRVEKEFSLKQNSRAAVLIKLETDLNVQVHVAELEVDEGILEVVLQVFDETLQNFVAKRISLNIHATETPFASPTSNEQNNV
jgi:hypothetical protein